jgi:hypothetical protein
MMLVVWDLGTGKAVCGKSVGHEPANAVKFYNHSSNKLLTVGNNSCRLWNPEYGAKRLDFVDISMGNLRRNICSVVVDDTDQFAYAGTKTGDILEFGLERALYKRSGPVRNLISQGVNCMGLLANGDLLIGAGDGTVAKMSTQNM